MSLQHIQLRAKEKDTSALEKALAGAKPKSSYISGPTSVKPYAGPTSTLDDTNKGATNLAKGYFRPGAGSLEEALRAATPATGSAPDIQGDAWAKRTEIVDANKAKLDAAADALYASVQGLEKKDQKYILDKIVGKNQSTDSLVTALGGGATTESVTARAERYEREGRQWTPEEQALHYAELNEQNLDWDKTASTARNATSLGVTDPMLKAMMDKNYIRKTESGYDWMLPEKEKKVSNIETILSDTGEQMNVVTYADGTQEVKHTYIYPAKEATGPSITEQINVEKLGMEKEGVLAKQQKERDDQHAKVVKEAIDLTGPKYRVGEVIGGKKVKQADVDNWEKEYARNYDMLLSMYEKTPSIPTDNLSLDMIPDTSPEVTTRKEEIALNKAQYEDRPDIIMTMEQLLGMTPTGKWSPGLEYMLFTYGMEGK